MSTSMAGKPNPKIRNGDLRKCTGPCARWLNEVEHFGKRAGGYRNSMCHACKNARQNELYAQRVARMQAAPPPTPPQAPASDTFIGRAWPGPAVTAFDTEPETCTSCGEPRIDGMCPNATPRGLGDDDTQELPPVDPSRQKRHASDFQALSVDDFEDEYATGVANVATQAGRKDSATASREKRQEFNARMGRFATSLRDAASTAHERGGEIASAMPDEHARYIRLLAEQERRFGNRRWARSIAIAEAHEQLSREAMINIAETYFRDKIEPAGYARLPKPEAQSRRTACVLLSDIHLGSELDSLDEPVSYRAFEEARRIEYVLRQFVDYKPQYRDKTSALVVINGDIIEGNLQHDLRAGSPLAEQKAIFWEYFSRFIAHVAECYPSVHVECQPGNHGRDKLRHPGRATSSKWDGHEWTMYYALRMMCSGLKNVTWSIPFRAVSIIDLFGAKLGATHADTELKLGDPDTKSKENAASLDRVNSTRTYGVEFDAWLFGHYHKARYQPRKPRVIWNAALVPPNGHARTSGYIGEPCGQFIWEAVEGHPIGDLRFIEVGEAQDHDERLGTLIKPFRFSMLEQP